MDFLISNEAFVVTPEDLQACLQFIAIDDNIAEDDEELAVTIVAEGQIIGNTTVIIIDNDGMCLVSRKHGYINYNTSPIGVEITITPEFLEATEGDESRVCATVTPNHERNVTLTFGVIPIGDFSGTV